jgi:glycosyltransferase involved in cell wall biosynthesis
MNVEVKSRIKALNCCVVIPTYNNENTLQKVIDDVARFSDNIMVVNDGSTDNTANILDKNKAIHIVSYAKNRGKGYAIKKAFKAAAKLGYEYVITIDADGQHFAKDIPVFIEKIEEEPNSILVGSRGLEHENMAAGSTFANKFSNFWLMVETGHKLPDTQSGYRMYPLKRMKRFYFFTTRYEFEVEVLVRSLWRCIKIIPVPVSVYYSPIEERVSHFRPFRDFSRISVLNTFLVPLAIIYGHPSIFIRRLFSKFGK